jgi:hypothetical protein
MSGTASSPVVDAQERPGPGRRRLGALDPWLVVSCGVAFVVYLVHGFDGALGVDLAVYSYAGQQVAEGQLPYEAIINRSGPLAHLIPGIGAWTARVVGADDVLGMRVMFMVISVVSVGLAYVVGRDLFRWRPAGLASAAALLSFECFTRFATYGPREKTFLVLCLLALLLTLLRGRWFTAGVFVSLGALTWQPTFLLAMTGAVVAVALSLPSGRWRALARVVVGGLVPVTVTVLAYLVAGELDVFLEDFLLINMQYTKQPGLFAMTEHGWGATIAGYGVSIWGFVVGLVALLVFAGRALTEVRGGPSPHRAALIAAGAMLVTGLLWSLKAFNSWPDTFIFMPMAALGIAGLATLLRERLPARVALAATLAWVLVATGVGAAYSWTARDTTYPETRADYRSVLALLPPDARILGIEAPEPLVIARKPNLSRYQLLGYGLMGHLKDTWPGGKQGYADWVVEEKPALVVVGTDPWTRWLVRKLTSEYRVVGTPPEQTWLVPRDLDPETTEALRQAIAREFSAVD